MNIFLAQISANIRQADIYEFISPALHNGMFRKPGRILNIDILSMRDLRNGRVEHHGLVAVDSPDSLQQSLRRLQNKRLNGDAVQVRPYFHRSWYNDPRQHVLPPAADFVEKRRGDRRRGPLLELLKSHDGYRSVTEQSARALASRGCIANLAIPAGLATSVIAQIEQQPALKLIGDARQPACEAPSLASSRTRVQVHGDSREIRQLLNRLKQQFPGSGIRFWIAVITDSGEF